MAAIPEFILRKLVVPNSIQNTAAGFSFDLLNTFAPATLTGIRLRVDQQAIEPAQIVLSPEGGESRVADSLSAEAPMALPVGNRVHVEITGPSAAKQMTVQANTREAGELAFTLRLDSAAQNKTGPAAPEKVFPRPGLFQRPLTASAEIDADEAIGEINPRVYGQFIEHLERCVYDGVWTADGAHLRQDVLAKIFDLEPPLMRYPGGNFASGYHWEDGIGPRAARPSRFDDAWKHLESNQVGTDEFMDFCSRIKSEPYLAVNDATGTPAEAARWVEYCNGSATSEQGKRRAAFGHTQPYSVKLWGVGNEVWGPWQIGHAGPEAYVARMRPVIEAMRSADPQIEIVAVGDNMLSDDPADPGRIWNSVVLDGAADLFDYLSFHIYQPSEAGWRESYDPFELYHTVCAAPLSVEHSIQRLSALIRERVPNKNIRLALDEWNLWLSPPAGSASMHQIEYTQRDVLYAASMLNVFHRQCQPLAIANLAQLVNVLPLIVTQGDKSFVTPPFYAFSLYRAMQAYALNASLESPTFKSEALGNMEATSATPYLDLTATRSADGRKLTLGLVNRHPTHKLDLSARLRGFQDLKARQGWSVHSAHPLVANSIQHPSAVRPQAINPPGLHGDHLSLTLPPASLTVLTYETQE